MTVVGTRPELIKLSCVLQALERYTQLIFVHTGQNYDYELNEIFFKDLQLRKPNYFLGIQPSTAIGAIAEIFQKIEPLIQQEKPDAFLIYGDTNSCLSALVAKRYKVPVFHMEAGNRCYDERVPEEINRRLLDHISDINMPLTEHSRRYLLNEGIRGDRILKIGSCMKEVLQQSQQAIEQSDVLERLGLARKGYFVVSMHREENVDEESQLRQVMEVLQTLGERYQKTIIFSVHPRTRKRLEKLKLNEGSQWIQLMRPLGFVDYVALEKHAFCTLSDSGTITEEAALLRFPAITLRNAHERPEGMDAGVLIMTGLQKDTILDAIEIVTAQQEQGQLPQRVEDYEIACVSMKVVRIILSYTGYIKREVWHEEDGK